MTDMVDESFLLQKLMNLYQIWVLLQMEILVHFRWRVGVRACASSCKSMLLFVFTLVTGPSRSLSLKLSDTRVYAPQLPPPASPCAPWCSASPRSRPGRLRRGRVYEIRARRGASAFGVCVLACCRRGVCPAGLEKFRTVVPLTRHARRCPPVKRMAPT